MPDAAEIFSSRSFRQNKTQRPVAALIFYEASLGWECDCTGLKSLFVRMRQLGVEERLTEEKRAEESAKLN